PPHRQPEHRLPTVELAQRAACGGAVDGRRRPGIVLEDLVPAERLAVDLDLGRRIGRAQGPDQRGPRPGGRVPAIDQSHCERGSRHGCPPCACIRPVRRRRAGRFLSGRQPSRGAGLDLTSAVRPDPR
ncbi:MAG: hypothetical protein ACK55I_32970, partial [bacterium]